MQILTMTAKLSLKDFLAQLNKLTKTEQLKIAKKINEKTIEQLCLSLDFNMSDIEMLEEEIMKEVKAVRFAETSEN